MLLNPLLLNKGARIAVIGAGISGIAAANVLKKNGFEAVVFEKAENPGGVWAVAYPDIHLQNTYASYHLSDFPWSFKPDLHPSGAQIMRYWQEAIKHLRLDVRLGHEVLALEEQSDGWLLRYKNQKGNYEETFKYVIIAVGQYTEGKYRPPFPGEEQFNGTIITERDVRSLDIFNDKRVAVVGFGKSALDMSTFAARRSKEVHHIFRTPRWTIPEWILGVHFTHILFSRFGTVMMTSWAHPTPAERFLHGPLKAGINKFWDLIASVFKGQIERLGKNKDQAAKERLNAVIPKHKFLPDLRSAGALAPESYYPLVADGKIQPHQAEVSGFTRNGIQLQNGCEIPCDLAVLSLGSKTPVFPFLPEKYRQLCSKANPMARSSIVISFIRIFRVLALQVSTMASCISPLWKLVRSGCALMCAARSNCRPSPKWNAASNTSARGSAPTSNSSRHVRSLSARVFSNILIFC